MPSFLLGNAFKCIKINVNVAPAIFIKLRNQVKSFREEQLLTIIVMKSFCLYVFKNCNPLTYSILTNCLAFIKWVVS